MATPFQFEAKDRDTIRDDYLRTLRSGLIARGVPNPNVTPDSDEYVRATALANELEVVEANAIVKADAAMPDTAEGEDLDVQLDAYGLARRGAAGSVGAVVFEASAASIVATGTQLIDGAGLIYEVTTGGTYSNGDSIPIAAVSLGSETNHDDGDVLTWASAPTYSAPTAAVAAGGLVNGVDAEDDDTARERLLARLRTPPKSGNWQHVAEIAEESSPSVQKAFVYPAIQGGATLHVAVTAAPTATDKTRDVATVTMTGTVVPYITGAMPEHVAMTITTVTNVEVDVAIGMTLPAAKTASPPGPGGGWLDGTPWPTRASSGYCDVTSVTSTTQFAVNADAAPTANVTRIAWLSPTEWKIYSALVTAVAGAGPYTVTIDTPFVGISVGCYVWPQSVNQAAYAEAFLNSMKLMGPGEKSSNVSALIRGSRKPVPSLSWPYSLNATVLRGLSSVGDEVLDVSYLARSTTTPAVPAVVTDPPKILVPRHVGFYPNP